MNVDFDDDDPISTYVTVFNYASTGRLASLKKLFSDKPLEFRKRCIMQAKADGEVCIVSAAKLGLLDVVQYILDECGGDIEQTGSVEFDSERVEGVTALWCAAASGSLNVVEFLVSRGAHINKRTITNSTPLRAACFDGHLKVVQYLMNHGADFEIPNRHGHTCLMIACFKQQHQVVEHLIKSGARINRQSSKGNTALHDCAESGNLQSLKMLLDNGACMRREEHGLSPIMSAGNAGFHQIVNELRRHKEVPIEDVIHALELLGAHHLDKDSRRDLAIERFTEALRLRDEHHFPKRRSPPLGWFTDVEEKLWKLQSSTAAIYNNNLNHFTQTNRETNYLSNPPPTPPPSSSLSTAAATTTTDSSSAATAVVASLPSSSRYRRWHHRVGLRKLRIPGNSPWKNFTEYYSDGHYFICTNYQNWLHSSSNPPGYHINEHFPPPICINAERYRYFAHKAFDDVREEFQTLAELMTVNNTQPDLIFLHALLIRLRILGPEQPEFLYHLRFRGAALADSGRLQQCVYMWLYALELVRRYLEPLHQVVHTSFHSCLNLYFFILSDRYDLFSPQQLSGETILSTLEMAVAAISRSTKWFYQNWLQSGAPWAYTLADKESNNLQSLCVSTLGLVHLLLEYFDAAPELHQANVNALTYGRPVGLTVKEKRQFLCLLFTLVRLKPIVRDGNTLLHLAFLRDSARLSRSNYLTESRLPLFSVGLLLIKVGHSPYVRNKAGQLPLCLLLSTDLGVELTSRWYLQQYLLRLLELNVHVDCADGFCAQRLLLLEAPLEMSNGNNERFCLKQHQTLQCLAAHAIKKSKFLTQQQINQLPQNIRQFLSFH